MSKELDKRVKAFEKLYNQMSYEWLLEKAGFSGTKRELVKYLAKLEELQDIEYELGQAKYNIWRAL